MLKRIARRWDVRSVELKRFRARDERVAARNRRLRWGGARLHCGCFGLVPEGGRADCQRECRCDFVHPHPVPPTRRDLLTYTGQRKALTVETRQLVRREHHYPTPDAHLDV